MSEPNSASRGGWLEEKIKELGPDKVAAFIGEPVQGAGGVIIPPSTYWPEIQRICDKYGVLLIADEVICGFGRLGTWFGSELMGHAAGPDHLRQGRDLGLRAAGRRAGGRPRGACAVEKGGDFNHGFTYSGHPVACAAALENMRIMSDERLVESAWRWRPGPYLKERFASAGGAPAGGHAESCGLVAGLNLVRRKGATVHDCVRFDAELAVGMMCRGICSTTA
jgi:putrescine aminotransferase